jgi:MFS family permease
MEGSSNAESLQRTLCSVITDPTLFLPLVLVAALQGGQQLSGINAVFYYSVSIFVSAGFAPTYAKWSNLGCGVINLITACFSPFLMSKINRRPLSFWSCFIGGCFLFLLTFIVHFINSVSWFAYACILAVFGYIIFYQLGLGPIPYFIGSELFEVGPRSAAMAIGSLSSWICNFIVAMIFPSLQSAIGAFVFLPFSIVCILLAFLLKLYLPETRGKNASEIAPLVSKGFKSRPTMSLI